MREVQRSAGAWDSSSLPIMGKQPKTLKSGLQATQHRLHKNAQTKAHQAAKLAEHKSKKSSGKAKPKPGQSSSLKPTIPFSSGDHILLIGEGNFSFARALLNLDADGLTIDPKNICATSYDTEEECYTKYSDAQEIVSVLRGKGVEVLFGIDAAKLHSTFNGKGKNKDKGRRWDKVVWNFPHAGKGITDMDRNIRANQEMFLGFLKSVQDVLKIGSVPPVHIKRKQKEQDPDSDDEGDVDMADELQDGSPRGRRGTVLVTLRNVAPYTAWCVFSHILESCKADQSPHRDFPKLAKKPPPTSLSPVYTQLRSFTFHRNIWKKYGYEHRMTKGERVGGLGTTGQGGEDRMWEFYLSDEKETKEKPQKMRVWGPSA